MTSDKAAQRVLRLGVAFAFLYPPYDALFNPYSWLGYFPPFVHHAATSLGVPDLVLLHSFGAFEVVIAVWILSGWKIFYPACLAALMLLAIVGFDHSDFEVLFRDLAIAAAAASLALGSLPGSRLGSMLSS